MTADIEPYRPLRQGSNIRLLRLSRSSLEAHSPLVMTEHCLDVEAAEVPEFFGLSYCWGSPCRTQTLLVNESSIKISENLNRGLKELAKLDEYNEALFWIDQICVNQQDLVERSHQVTMMHRIYQTAVKTVIWLFSPPGPSGVPESYDRGWKLAEELYGIGHSSSDWANDVRWLKVPHPLQRAIPGPSLASLGLPDVADSAWQELKSILSNNWFSRVWVFQEAALSRLPPSIVHAGRSRSLEPILWSGAWLWQVKGPALAAKIPHSDISNVYTMFTIALSKTPWRIEPLLIYTDDVVATDLRDKVIGLLGLSAPESLPRSWVPNYQNSTVAGVYRDVTRAIVQETGKLLMFEMLNYDCGSGYRLLWDLPSWTPRFCDVWSPVFATVQDQDGGSTAQRWRPGFETCGGRPAQVLKQSDPNILTLRGLKVGEIAWVSPVPNREESEPCRLLRWVIDGMRRFCLDGRESPEAFINRFFSTAALAIGIDEFPTAADLREHISQQDDLMSDGRSFAQILTLNSKDLDWENAENVLEGRRRIDSNFFVTKSGNIGFGPKWTAEGDFVVVLYGCEAPLIVRRREDQDQYLLLGCSYVPG
jgi:hypothetical protein